MPNLRVVYDNAAQRATLTASSEAGNLVVGNLKTLRKQAVWRATAKTATLTAVFSNVETIGCVALPFCNFTSTATIRARVYTLAADTTPTLDTGVQLACAYAPFDQWDWGNQPLGVNAFSYGGAPYAAIWFTQTPGMKVVIDITDNDNLSAYIEAACLVIGNYWSPKFNADYGASVVIQERSRHERSEASDLRTDRGTRSRKVAFDLKLMPPSDRSQLWNIMVGNGMTTPLFFSLTPESNDPTGEQMYQVYGKLPQQSKIAMQAFEAFQAPIEIEEV